MKYIFLFSLAWVVFSCSKKTNMDVISVSERQILVNENPYLIKGICYHPVPKGSKDLSFNSLDQDLALMVEAGINTIRVYAPIDNKDVLDKIHDAGLKVIIGFGYNQGGRFDILSGTFVDYINTFKNHPAILMWELGNEYNYHPEWFNDDLNNWYDALEQAVDAIHAIDTFHPVTTAHGEIPDSVALYKGRNLDMWGFNVYRWDVPGSFFTDWAAISDKPFYFSEVGADSYMTVATDTFVEGTNESAQHP